MMTKLVPFFILLVLFARPGFARGYSEPSKLSWDLGAAFGSYYNYSYSEIDLGLNWRFKSPMNWRNVLWDRLGSGPVAIGGLDSSLRFEFGDTSSSEDLGVRVFAGPGVRISNANFTGEFVEAGAVFRLGGLNLGAGVKEINYNTPGKDPVTGAQWPNQDTVIFIIIAGGGSL